jgi:hypothetical protein
MKGITPAIIGATGMVEFNADQVPPLLKSPARFKIALITGYGRIFAGSRKCNSPRKKSKLFIFKDCI